MKENFEFFFSIFFSIEEFFDSTFINKGLLMKPDFSSIK